MIFADILYRKIELPEWLIPFLRIPEFVRLRGVRLSNVDSFEFKDFNGPTRWEHCLGVAYLAIKCSEKMGLSERDKVHLVLASLLHDIATPPFAHTVEYILENFDHELESNRILSASSSIDHHPSFPIFASQIPQFHNTCKSASKHFNFKIDPDEVADLVIGNGRYGYLVNGTIDLDNIDNVLRASLYLGIEIDRSLPLKLVDWLSTKSAVPINIKEEPNVVVQSWLHYRNQMYGYFYNSSDEELGRQAFLQHLIRRSYNEGLSRSSIIWNTDEALLTKIECLHELNHYDSNGFHENSLKSLVQRYRLLEPVFKFAEIAIEKDDNLRILKNPLVANWLEKELATPTFEPFVLINSRRYSENAGLFPADAGTLVIYKLGSSTIKFSQLPEWMQEAMPFETKGAGLIKYFNKLLNERMNTLLTDRPWLNINDKRKEDIKSNLDSVGNWSFRLSKNESIHSYPATFVHAIPATLISSLGLKGELILDPFGGSGRTAIEAIKLGCRVVSSDSNTIANLIARTKTTFLSKDQRQLLVSIKGSDVTKVPHGDVPNFDNIYRWHNQRTILELCQIRNFIDIFNDEVVQQFLTLCFSDILTSCTGRKGKEHGYFADNTPLAKGEDMPQYENAIQLFINKIAKNTDVIERFYSLIEKNGLNPQEELEKAKIIQTDVTKASLDDLGIAAHSVSGIVTSPPYLCMADYTLGQRLSYYWLFPDKIDEDFKNEIGTRRGRSNPKKAYEDYLHNMRLFAKKSSKLLKKGGFLATVIGAPVANAFNEKNLLEILDSIFEEEGFELLWSSFRPIHWHRNHGYARLNNERVAVHYLK